MNLDNLKKQLAELDSEKKQLANRRKTLTGDIAKKKKDNEKRKKFIVGAIILKELDKKEGLRTYVVGLLKNLREGDRELFSDLLQPKEAEDKSSS